VDVQTFDVMPDSSHELLEMYVSEHNAQSAYYEFIIVAILCLKLEEYIGHAYFPAYKTHRPIRRTMIFSLKTLEKNDDEYILILVIYWKKTGLLHIL
jgi:hypothetical protein